MERTFTEREKQDALEFAYCMGLNRPDDASFAKSTEPAKSDALSFAISMGLNTGNKSKNDYRSQYNGSLICSRQKALG